MQSANVITAISATAQNPDRGSTYRRIPLGVAGVTQYGILLNCGLVSRQVTQQLNNCCSQGSATSA